LASLALLTGGCAAPEAHRSPASQPTKEVRLRFCIASNEPREGYELAKDEAGQPLYVASEPFLTQHDVRRASTLVSGRRNLVLLEFYPLAARKLDEWSAEHVGERLAILLDDELLMSPVLTSRIGQGKVVLEGEFSNERAQAIARALSPEP
jgi:preprotein translocase subunit SecD